MIDAHEPMTRDDDFYQLAMRYLDNQLHGDDELAHLQEMLASDASRRKEFAEISLHWAMMAELPAECIQSLCGLEGIADIAMPADEDLSAAALPIAECNFAKTALPAPRKSLALDAAWQGTVHYFSSGWPLAYLITTVLFTAGLFYAYLTPVSTSSTAVQIAAQQTRGQEPALDGGDFSPNRTAASCRMSATVVGKITEASDCKWRMEAREASGERKHPVRETVETHGKQGADAPRSPSLICFGDRLSVSSGLLEITYKTGAKVTLEGPCTFRVEANGGFLVVGRLTGEMEKGSGIRGQGPEDSEQRVGENRKRIPSPSPLAPRPSSAPCPLTPDPFVIATPTALVTDLGTEFGVDVDRSKATTISVIRGEVLASRSSRAGTPIHERLTAGQAIYIASLNDLPIRLDLSERSRPKTVQNHLGGRGVRLVLSPELRKSLQEVTDSRNAQKIVEPIGLIATAYCHVLDKDGKMLAENNRRLAFQVVTDGVFGRGVGGEGPRSSFDTALLINTTEKSSKTGRLGDKETRSVADQTLSKKHQPKSPSLLASQSPQSAFVGLRYDHAVRFDRIKIFFAAQTKEGGSWAAMPKLYILKNPVDTDRTPPEQDQANWLELPHYPLVGAFDAHATPGPGAVLEMALTGLPEKDRTGYGWAIGGVPANGASGYLSITELRAYSAARQEINENGPSTTYSDSPARSPKPVDRGT